MHKLLTTALLLLPTLALAQPDPCKWLNKILYKVESAYEAGMPLVDVLDLLEEYNHDVTKGVYSMMPRGEVIYNVYRQGVTDGCYSMLEEEVGDVKN